MKRLTEVALGMVTGVGGFLEAGSIATSAQAGADFGYRLPRAVALGTLALIVPLVVGLVVSLLVLAWDPTYLDTNRISAALGNTLGGALARAAAWRPGGDQRRGWLEGGTIPFMRR